MERALIVLLVCLMAAFFVNGEGGGHEEELEGPQGVKAYVERRGGGISVYREMKPPGKKPRKTGKIQIRLGKIEETCGGNDTDRRRRPRKPPKIDKPDDIGFNVDKKPKRNLQRHGGPEIEGNCLILRSPPLKEVNDSVLTLTVCVIKTNGSLRIGDEDTDVSSGQLKFSVQLDNWPWSCNETDEQAVDIDVILKLPHKRMAREHGGHGRPKRPKRFDLGDNSTITFPRQVECDNRTVDMPEGFPSPPKKRGDDFVITLRIPRFNTTMFYDPIVDSLNENPGDDSASGGVAQYASVVSLSIGLLLATKFAF